MDSVDSSFRFFFFFFLHEITPMHFHVEGESNKQVVYLEKSPLRPSVLVLGTTSTRTD